MKKTFWIKFSIIVLVVLGSLAWVVVQYNALLYHRSPIASTPPLPGKNLGEPASNQVVFILVDALRSDTVADRQLMPQLNLVRDEGASAVMHSRPPSFSAPGWGTLFTGAWPDLNDSPPFNLSYTETIPWTQDTLFSALSENGMTVAVSGYDWFEKLIPQDLVSASFYTPGEDQAADQAVMEAALPWIGDPQYNFILIHLDQVDYAGHHEGGPQNNHWNEAAARVDRWIGIIRQKLDLSETTLIICSDHGQIDQGGHGGSDPVTLLEPFIIAGKGVNPGQYADIQMADVAPTISALLGLHLPASSQGQVLTEMISLPESTLRQIPLDLITQQTELLSTYAQAIGAQTPIVRDNSLAGFQTAIQSVQTQRLNSERLLRLALIVPLYGLLFILFIRHMKRSSGRLLLCASMYLAVFTTLYTLIAHKLYSFSNISSPLDLLLSTLWMCAIALVLSWLIGSWSLNSLSMRSARAAERTLDITLAILLGIFLPVVYHTIINGFLTTWILPDLEIAFIGVYHLLQASIVGLFGLCLSGITYFLTRKNIPAVK